MFALECCMSLRFLPKNVVRPWLCACLHPQPGPYSQPAPGVGMWKMKGEPENTGLLVMAEVNQDKRHNGIHSSRLASDGGR